MEPTEIHEFTEHLKEAGESIAGKNSIFAVSFSISVLAVLVALVTVLGHRTHTEAVLLQARASDQWNLYQAKKIRQTDVGLTSDILSVLAVSDASAAAKKLSEYASHEAKWDKDLAEEQAKARDLEKEVELAEHRATRFDIGEALLQIAVVLASVTLLTRSRAYWLMGLFFGLVGIGFAASTALLH